MAQASCLWSSTKAKLDAIKQVSPLNDPAAGRGAPLEIVRGHFGSIDACAWSPEGGRLATGSDDGTVNVWEASRGRCFLTLRGHESVVASCVWSPDGDLLLSASDDGTLKLWNAANGELMLTLLDGADGDLASVDLRGNRIHWAAPEAWRRLAWRWTDPETGQIRMLPAEHFGPLPGA